MALPETLIAFVVLSAPFVGSFLTVLIARLPAGQQVVFGRSRCPHCAKPIPFRNLVPILGWFLCRGRCGQCGHKVALWYPVVEIMATVAAIWAFMAVPGWPAFVTCILGWCLIVIAFCDWQRFIIPDGVVLPLIAAGLVVGFLLGSGLDHLLGAVVGYLLFRAIAAAYAVLRKKEGLGQGDAKLFAAAGAWVSWMGLPSVLLWACLGGLVFVLVRAGRHFRVDPRHQIPFGVFLSIGIWLVWLFGPLQIL